MRSRLFAAFVLVAFPPLFLFAGAVYALVARELEKSAIARLASSLGAATARFEDLRRSAEARVAAVAEVDLPELGEEPVWARLAGSLAARHGLTTLEIVGADGRILSSHHWQAGLGLPDRDRTFRNAPGFRLEQVAEGYGAAERLTLVAQRASAWRGLALTVRGGFLIDPAFIAELSGLMGTEAAIRDAEHEHWIVAEGSPLRAWANPTFGAAGQMRGEIALPSGSYRWAATALGQGLFLVVAMPETALAQVTAGVGRLTAGVGALALVAALVMAVVFSRRIARPVQSLAEGARRIAEGDLSGSIDATAPGEVGDLGRAFNTMTEELRASRERLLQAERVAAWREMARRLAHELKNPIFPIQLSIETLRRALTQPTTDTARFPELFRESSDTILEELRSLRKIVDEFSEFARMPRPQLEATDLSEVARQALALYEPRAGKVEVRSELATDLPRVQGDRDLLRRALANLIANALEAMPDGGVLTVRTQAAPDGVRTEVRDTGPGLTEEQRTRLFTPYYTTKKAGTGLGLAIVQGIVSDHGGRIQVASEPGQGTSFTIVLPTGDKAEHRAPGAPGPKP